METKLRSQLVELYQSTPCMPILVRLAWHDAGTYCAKTKTGGANGSIRFAPEASHGANNGLKIARDLLAPIKEAHPDVSYADLYQLASVVGIEHAGGPKIPFRFGRVDATEADCTADGRLPDANKRMPHLRDIFHRMGFTDAEIVTLSGAHALGRAHKDRSGFEGAWTEKPLVFDNTYYKELLKEKAGKGILRLASDAALSDEPELKKQVEKYAEDQDAFFIDYIAAHVKLSELGMECVPETGKTGAVEEPSEQKGNTEWLHKVVGEAKERNFSGEVSSLLVEALRIQMDEKRSSGPNKRQKVSG